MSFLSECLNTMYDDVSSNDCNPNANVSQSYACTLFTTEAMPAFVSTDPFLYYMSQEEILQHNENIYYNYLAQFASILPKTLVQNLNATVQLQLEGNTGPDAQALQAQLDELWKQASVSRRHYLSAIYFHTALTDMDLNVFFTSQNSLEQNTNLVKLSSTNASFKL